MNTNKEIGEIGERIAEEYLFRNKYKVLDRNFRKSYGEIDIVARIKNTLVCVEVKTSASMFKPEWQITTHKLKKFKRIIEVYIAENKLQNMSIRADVILVNINRGTGEHVLEHIEGIEF